MLGFPTQAFHAWDKNPVTLRILEDAYAVNALVDAHGDDPKFGYRFIVDELERAGIEIRQRSAWRLCSQRKLRSKTVTKDRNSKRPGPPVNDDPLRRDFTTA